MNKVGAPGTARRAGPGAIGLLGSAGEARRRYQIAGAADAEWPLSPCVINTALHRPDSAAAAAWRTRIMIEHAADRSAVDPFGVRSRYARPLPESQEVISRTQVLLRLGRLLLLRPYGPCSQSIGTHDRVEPPRSSSPAAASLPKT